MDNIELPRRMQESFAGIARAVLSVFPAGDRALGGGTVLEARWGHRVSTDLDFFIAADLLSAAYQRRGRRMYALLYDAIKSEGASINEGRLSLGANSLFMDGECADGTPWSIANMHYSNPNQPMRETINGTGIRAATVTETLMGKIVGRAFVANTRQAAGKEPIPIRDCYDICVGGALVPDVLDRVLGIIPPAATDRIASNFRSAPHDLHLRDSKPIVSPSWTMPLRGIASRIGDAVSARDVGLLPVAKPLGASKDDTNNGVGSSGRANCGREREPSP